MAVWLVSFAIAVAIILGGMAIYAATEMHEIEKKYRKLRAEIEQAQWERND